jgi:hypothetical protein
MTEPCKHEYRLDGTHKCIHCGETFVPLLRYPNREERRAANKRSGRKKKPFF